MILITDRTAADVTNGTSKGRYDYTDLNRVESAVEELMTIAATAGIQMDLSTKTDWARPGLFSAQTWVTESQMERYLRNVHLIADAVQAGGDLPGSMNNLDWRAANSIEQALEKTHTRLQGIIAAWKYSGMMYAGERSPL